MDKLQIFKGAQDSVCRQEREKLSGREWEELAKSELGKLGGGNPNYNTLGIPILYAGRYHLGQMSLCYSFLSSSTEQLDQYRSDRYRGKSLEISLAILENLAGISLEGIVNSNRRDATTIRILDFGCGMMALQWAVAWVADELIRKGIDVPKIEVFNYDPSTPMVEMGEYLWHELNEWVQGEGDESMKFAMEKITMKRIVKDPLIWSIEGRGNLEFDFDLLTGIHIVYSQGDVEDFSQIVRKYCPNYAMLTTTKARSKHDLIKENQIDGYKAENIKTEWLRVLRLPYWDPYNPFARLYHRES